MNDIEICQIIINQNGNCNKPKFIHCNNDKCPIKPKCDMESNSYGVDLDKKIRNKLATNYINKKRNNKIKRIIS